MVLYMNLFQKQSNLVTCLYILKRYMYFDLYLESDIGGRSTTKLYEQRIFHISHCKLNIKAMYVAIFQKNVISADTILLNLCLLNPYISVYCFLLIIDCLFVLFLLALVRPPTFIKRIINTDNRLARFIRTRIYNIACKRNCKQNNSKIMSKCRLSGLMFIHTMRKRTCEKQFNKPASRLLFTNSQLHSSCLSCLNL
jgi:hypothetical protein